MAKTVGDLLIKLGVDGLDGVTALKSALRTLGQASNASDKQLEGLRKEIVQVAKASNVSQQAIRGQIDAFKGLKQQATIGSTVYRKLGKDIDSLTESLDRLNRKEEEAAKKPRTAKQIFGEGVAVVPEKFSRQIAAGNELLQKLGVTSNEYATQLAAVTARTQEFSRAQQRQQVVAQNLVATNRAQTTGFLQSTKVNIENTHTTAALKQKIAELAQDLDNIDVGSKEYITTSNRLKEAQEELNVVLGISRKAFDELSMAQERAERRAAKLAGIQAAQAGAVGTRDPRTGAMIAGGSAVASLVQQPVREISGLYQSIGAIGMSGISADIDRMGKSVKEVTRDIKAAAAASNGSANSLQAQRSALVQLQAGLDPVSQDFRELAREIDKVDRKLGKLGKKRFSLKGAAQTVGAVASAGIFGGAPGAAGALLGAPFGPGGAVIGGGIGTSVGVGAQQISGFTNYAASIRLAEKAMERILQKEGEQVESARRVALANEAIEYAVNQLNVEREDATVGMTRLSAAVLGAGGTIETAALAFLGTTKAIKATKGSAEDVRGGLTALVQMFSKGKISAEELSGQLGERFPAAVTAFAEANDISTSELQTMLKNGEVGLDRLVKFLVFVTKKYSDGALEMAASAEESGERQKRSFDEVRRVLGEQLIDVGAKLQEGIADSLKTLTPVIVNLAKAVAGAIELLVNGIVIVIKNFRNLIDVVTVLAGGVVLGSLLTMIKKVTVAMGAKGFAYSVQLLSRFIRFKLVTSVGLLISKLKALAITMARNPITLLALGFTALGVSMFRASQRHKDFIDDITSGVVSLDDAGKRLDKYKKRLETLHKLQVMGITDPEAVSAGLREAGKTTRRLPLTGRAGEAQRLAESLRGDPDLPLLQLGTMDAINEAAGITYNQMAGIRTAMAARAPEEGGFNIDELYKNLGINNFESFDGGGAGDAPMGDIELALRRQMRGAIAAEDEILKAHLQLALDLTAAREETEDVNKRINMEEQAYADFDLAKKKILEDQNKELEEQGKLLQQAGRELADARHAVTLISQEERQRIEINRKVAEFIEKYAGVLSSEELHTAMAQFRADLEKANSAAFKFQQGLREVFDEAMNVAEAVGEVGVNAVRDLGDAFADFVTTGKANFRDFANSVISDLARIFARRALFQGLSLIPGVGSFLGLGGGGGGGGGGGDSFAGVPNDILDSVLGNANGNVFAKNKIVPYAMGGVVGKPTLFKYANGGSGRFGLMGEAGPEAIMPLRRGANGKLGVEASGGAMGNITVNVDASGSSVEGDDAQASQLGKAIGVAVQQELIKQKRPGGLLAS